MLTKNKDFMTLKEFTKLNRKQLRTYIMKLEEMVEGRELALQYHKQHRRTDEVKVTSLTEQLDTSRASIRKQRIDLADAHQVIGLLIARNPALLTKE